MRPVIFTRQLDAADPNAICLDQTTGGAGNLNLNGVLVVGGVALLDQQRRVELESAGNLSALTFTITGTNEGGQPIEESLLGPNATTVETVLDFFTVTQIAVDGTVGTNVEIGTNGVGASQVIPIDQYLSPTNIGLGLVITDTVNVTVEHTFDDIFDGNPSTPRTWFDNDDAALVNAVANQNGNFSAPPRAIRLLTNSGAGTCVFTLVQAGAIG